MRTAPGERCLRGPRQDPGAQGGLVLAAEPMGRSGVIQRAGSGNENRARENHTATDDEPHRETGPGKSPALGGSGHLAEEQDRG